MDIKEDEIKEVKNIGKLNGGNVQLIALKGGFHIGLGLKNKNSNKKDILAVGSHPAIVNHLIHKQFTNDFEQTMEKSEQENMPNLIDYSVNLDNFQKNVLGLDIYALEKNEEIEFTVTKHNFEVFSVKAQKVGDCIHLKKTEKKQDRLTRVDKKSLAENIEKSIKKYAKDNNLKIKKDF